MLIHSKVVNDEVYASLLILSRLAVDCFPVSNFLTAIGALHRKNKKIMKTKVFGLPGIFF